MKCTYIRLKFLLLNCYGIYPVYRFKRKHMIFLGPIKEEKSATTVVIGGITGSVLGLSAVAAVVIYWKRRKNPSML